MDKKYLTKDQIKELLEATGKFVDLEEENGIFHIKFKPWDAYMTIPDELDLPKLIKWICSICTENGRKKGKFELKRKYKKLMGL